jgi:hypothetical protein
MKLVNILPPTIKVTQYSSTYNQRLNNYIKTFMLALEIIPIIPQNKNTSELNVPNDYKNM